MAPMGTSHILLPGASDDAPSGTVLMHALSADICLAHAGRAGPGERISAEFVTDSSRTHSYIRLHC